MGFLLVLLYLFFEFGRPQAIVPGLKSFPLPGIISAALALFIILSNREGKFADRQTKYFILLLILMAFHVPTATNNYWAFQVARTMAQTFVIYLGIITFVDSPEKFEKLMKYWVGIHVILAIFGILTHGKGIGGFLADENDFCMTLNMVIPIALFMALSEKSNMRRFIYIACTLLFLFADMLTSSRGGFIGLVSVGIWCWIRLPKKILGAGLIILLILFMYQFAPEKYWTRIQTIQSEGYEQGTGGERVYEWKIGWKMFIDNPIIGVGQGNFPFRFGQYEAGETHHGRSRAGRAAHSIYFTLLPELGMVGFLIFLGVLLSSLKYLRRVQKSKSDEAGSVWEGRRKSFYAKGFEGSLLTYLVTGAFISILYYPNFWVLAGFIAALNNSIGIRGILAQREHESG